MMVEAARCVKTIANSSSKQVEFGAHSLATYAL